MNVRAIRGISRSNSWRAGARVLCPFWVLLSLSLSLPAQSVDTEGPLVTVGTTARTKPIGDGLPHKLSGKVINRVTREPIARALVEIAGLESHSVFTGPEGDFEIPNVTSGEYIASASRPNFYESRRYEPGDPPRKIVIVNADLTCTFELLPKAVITGRVTGPDGEPLQNVEVVAQANGVLNGNRQPGFVGLSVTRSDGRYRIFGLQPGRYYIVARQTSRGEYEGARVENDQNQYAHSLYYPGTQDRASATLVKLAPGQTFIADISVPIVPMYSISGTVVGSNNLKPERLLARRDDDTSENAEWTPIDPNGHFELHGISSGAYNVCAIGGLPTSEKRGEELAAVCEKVVIASGSVTNLRLQLQSSANIPVEIQYSPSTVDAGTDMRFGLGVRLRGKRFFEDIGAQAGEAGALRLLNVMRGDYAVEFFPSRNWYVASAEMQGVDLLRQPLTVASGGNLAPIQVVLRSDPGSISGDVALPSDAGPFSIVAVPESTPTQPPRIVRFHDGANIRIPIVAPGRYRIFAVDHPSALNWDDPEVLKRYSSQMSEVDVAPKGAATVHLSLIRTDDDIEGGRP